jgi:hypothetical protein
MDSAFYPIISQMQRAAGLAHDDTTKAKLDKLDTLLAQSSTPRQDAALFAKMLEMTKAVLEMVSEANAQQIAASVPPSTLAVPASGDCSRSTRGVHQKATKGRPPTSTGPDARPRPAAHTIVVACVLP